MAEWAIAFPAVALTLAVVLGGISLTVDRGRLHQAAADAQRVHSWGGSHSEMTQTVHGVLKTIDASVSLSDGSAPFTSCVTVVRSRVSWVGSLVSLPRQATSCGLVVPR